MPKLHWAKDLSNHLWMAPGEMAEKVDNVAQASVLNMVFKSVALMRFVLLMPALLFFAHAPGMADPAIDGFRKLDAREIKRAFAGRTFSDDVHFSFWYAPDGRIEGTGMGAKVASSWRTDRDELCVTDANGETCYGVWKKGGSVKLIVGDQDISLDGDLN